jgi:hypothetical protein
MYQPTTDVPSSLATPAAALLKVPTEGHHVIGQAALVLGVLLARQQQYLRWRMEDD